MNIAALPASDAMTLPAEISAVRGNCLFSSALDRLFWRDVSPSKRLESSVT
jgi:hypothetical protein